jgi:HAMP domain-containing protein
VEWALSARSEIRNSIEQEFLTEVQDILGDYRAVSDEQFRMLNTYGAFTRVPPEAIAGLQRLSFQGFEALANQQLDTLANGVYQATLTGRGKADFINDLRGSINGIYQASDQEEIRQLVEVAQAATGARQQEAVDRLHSVYAADRLGNNLRRYASLYATDSLNQYSATLTVTTANEQGIDRFEYYGDLITDSRQFCRDHVDKVYTRDQIEKIWKGEWAGKAPGDPFIVRGGYNCRHQWLPIVRE